ncbi:hypothetical protein MC885_018899 [Smutsia gigantea]|nr:hypothetical protein MC885_018899 [Smutsia gigantea]
MDFESCTSSTSPGAEGEEQEEEQKRRSERFQTSPETTGCSKQPDFMSREVMKLPLLSRVLPPRACHGTPGLQQPGAHSGGRPWGQARVQSWGVGQQDRHEVSVGAAEGHGPQMPTLPWPPWPSWPRLLLAAACASCLPQPPERDPRQRRLSSGM